MRIYGSPELDSLRCRFPIIQATKVARIAVVTGRRRIGKSLLIQQECFVCRGEKQRKSKMNFTYA